MPSVSALHSVPLRGSGTAVPDVPFAVVDAQRTTPVSSNADKTRKSSFPSEVVGSLFRNKNKGRSHFVVHPQYEGNACKQISKCIRTYQSLLPTWTRPAPSFLGSLSPSLHVRQIPALCTLAREARIAAPLATESNLHLRSHSRPAAVTNSALALCLAPQWQGLRSLPAQIRQARGGGSGAELIFPTGYCRHWCVLARRYKHIGVSAVVSFLLPLSRPSNGDVKELCNCMVIAQLGLQDAAPVLISFQLPSLQ